MTTLNIKIVGIEGESVLVKYVSENSAKPIDEYGAVAYQPKAMGYNSLEEFIEGIKPNLVSLVDARDASEQSPLNLSSWVDYNETHEVETTPEVIIIPDALPVQQPPTDIPEVVL